jgi:lysophospholipase L1-like esterase
MKLGGKIIIGALTLLFLFGGAGRKSSVPHIVKIYGDSHMVNMGPRIQSALEARGYQVAVDAVVGRSLQTVLDAGSIQADLAAGWLGVVVEFGTNDANIGVGWSQLQNQLAELVRQASPSRVTFIGPPPALRADLAPKVVAYDALLRQLAGQYGVDYISSFDLTDGGWASDGVHLTQDAYARWADALTSRL